VQPRIRLLRSFDECAHAYLGFVLSLEGECGDRDGVFTIAVSSASHAKHGFRRGMMVSGASSPVADPRLEPAEFYSTSAIRVRMDADAADLPESPAGSSMAPPFFGAPPPLDVYRERGHRRLDPRTYQARCSCCLWGCRMPVEMTVDHWKPSLKRYRFETFCYGPKSCPSYRAGATRKVPGRHGMSFEEEDWIDEDRTSHRDPDE
jgi:hypothetical protein